MCVERCQEYEKHALVYSFDLSTTLVDEKRIFFSAFSVFLKWLCCFYFFSLSSILAFFCDGMTFWKITAILSSRSKKNWTTRFTNKMENYIYNSQENIEIYSFFSLPDVVPMVFGK